MEMNSDMWSARDFASWSRFVLRSRASWTEITESFIFENETTLREKNRSFVFKIKKFWALHDSGRKMIDDEMGTSGT